MKDGHRRSLPENEDGSKHEMDSSLADIVNIMSENHTLYIGLKYFFCSEWSPESYASRPVT